MRRFLALLCVALFVFASCGTTVITQSSVMESEEISVSHILNKRTKKFHKPNCSFVKLMKPSNSKAYDGDRSHLIKFGYSPCGHCLP